MLCKYVSLDTVKWRDAYLPTFYRAYIRFSTRTAKFSSVLGSSFMRIYVIFFSVNLTWLRSS